MINISEQISDNNNIKVTLVKNKKKINLYALSKIVYVR